MVHKLHNRTRWKKTDRFQQLCWLCSKNMFYFIYKATRVITLFIVFEGEYGFQELTHLEHSSSCLNHFEREAIAAVLFHYILVYFAVFTLEHSCGRLRSFTEAGATEQHSNRGHSKGDRLPSHYSYPRLKSEPRIGTEPISGR